MKDKSAELKEMSSRCRVLMQDLKQRRRNLDSLMSQAVTLLSEAKDPDKNLIREISETFKEYHEMI